MNPASEDSTLPVILHELADSVFAYALPDVSQVLRRTPLMSLKSRIVF